jgi:enediyne biosynthesis protein E4
LQLSLQQSTGNLFAFGARVGLERTGVPTMWRRVRTDGSYLSASDARVQFGLGANRTIDAVIVQWPDGASERWTHVTADRTMSLRRGTGSPLPLR